MSETIMRFQVADYLNIANRSTPQYALMGVGFNSLDESPNAQTDSKTYIHQSSQSSQIKSYQTQFSFDTDLIADEEAVMKIYDIARNHRTGAEAETDYIRVELYTGSGLGGNNYEARKFSVAIGVSSIEGNGGETLKVKGTLYGVGDPVAGVFNTETKKFTPLGS